MSVKRRIERSNVALWYEPTSGFLFPLPFENRAAQERGRLPAVTPSACPSTPARPAGAAGSAMELYEDAFKLQEMIESDMRAEVEHLLTPGSGSELRCAADAGESLDSFDSPLGTSVWLGSHGISLLSDLEGFEGLLVDPQTGLPSHRSSLPQATLVTLAATVADVAEPEPVQQRAPSRTSQERSYPKPAYSYSCLIAMALRNSRTGSLPVNEIYSFMT